MSPGAFTLAALLEAAEKTSEPALSSSEIVAVVVSGLVLAVVVIVLLALLPDREARCQCGHPQNQHPGSGPCDVRGCVCERFEAERAET